MFMFVQFLLIAIMFLTAVGDCKLEGDNKDLKYLLITINLLAFFSYWGHWWLGS